MSFTGQAQTCSCDLSSWARSREKPVSGTWLVVIVKETVLRSTLNVMAFNDTHYFHSELTGQNWLQIPTPPSGEQEE